MSNVSSNYSASLGDFVRLSGTTARSEGNFYLENNGKGGFILGIDNHHRHITGLNKGKGLSGSEAARANNRNINLDFYNAFCAFVNASEYSKRDSVRAVLAEAGRALLQKKSEEDPNTDKGLETALERRTVSGLMRDLENAIKGEQGKFDKEHPLFKMKASEIFEAIKGQKCGGWFARGVDEADYFLKCVWKEGGFLSSAGGGIENVKGADQTNEDGNKMIRSYLSAALDKLAVDILKDVKSSEAGLTDDALNDIKAIRAKARELMIGANIGKALSVKEAKSLAECYDAMARKHLPENGTTRTSAYDGGLVGKAVGSETLALQAYENELARIRNLKVAAEVPPPPPPVVPPSPQFTDALKNVLGKTSLTLNAEQAANALLSPLLGHLKAHTSAFVGGVEVKAVEDGLLVLKLTDIVAKDFLGKLVPELVSDNPNDTKGAAAGLGAKVNFGDLEALSISLVPKIVHEPVQGDESNPPRTRSVLRLTVPKTGAWRVTRGANEQTGVSDLLAGVLDNVPENLLKGPGYEVKKGGQGDANLATVDVDLNALKVDALAKFGLSAADLTSLKVGANGVQFGFCEPAGHRPANPQPGAGAAGFNAPHSLEAEIGTADLVTNAKTLVREHLTKKQEGLAHDSPEWQSLENNKGLLNGLGRLALTTDPADETITLGADGMRLGDNPERLGAGAVRSLVDTLNPSSLSVKLKPRMEAPGRLSAEVKGISLTGSTFTAKLLSWALKFKPLRKFGFWLFKDKITAGVTSSLGPQATIVMQDDGWPKVTLPVGTFTQGILGGATDVGAALSELKVTNRGVRFGIDVEHVVRNPVVAATNSEEATLMADVRTILGKRQNAITPKDIQALQTGWNSLIAMKTRIGALIAAANRRKESSTVKPMSLADARVTLKRIEDDIKEFETKGAALSINGPWRQA